MSGRQENTCGWCSNPVSSCTCSNTQNHQPLPMTFLSPLGHFMPRRALYRFRFGIVPSRFPGVMPSLGTDYSGLNATAAIPAFSPFFGPDAHYEDPVFIDSTTPGITSSSVWGIQAFPTSSTPWIGLKFFNMFTNSFASPQVGDYIAIDEGISAGVYRISAIDSTTGLITVTYLFLRNMINICLFERTFAAPSCNPFAEEFTGEYSGLNILCCDMESSWYEPGPVCPPRNCPKPSVNQGRPYGFVQPNQGVC